MTKRKTLYLPVDLRQELKKPWGICLWGSPEEVEKKYQETIREKRLKTIITIGDRCSLLLSSDIKVFDGLINRKKVAHDLSSTLCCKNPPATIQKSCWPVLKKAISTNQNVRVEGEEDLLVIPAVLLSEQGTGIVYGLLDKGICLIEVSPQIKKRFRELLSQFLTSPPGE